MNKKIKELANQANLLDADGWNTTNMAISVDTFADLILQEALVAIDSIKVRTYKNGDPEKLAVYNCEHNRLMDYAADTIKKHFGRK